MTFRCSLLLLATLLFAQSLNATTRFFLGVGSSYGLEGETPLRWATSDAKKMRDVFTDLGGVHKSRAILLVDPDSDAFERAIIRLQGNVEEAVRQGERAEVIVHYAGHGDKDSLHIGGARFPLALLRERLAAVPAQAMVVVVDACRTSVQSRGATLGPRFNGAVVKEIAPNGTVLLFSARDGEVAQESDALEGAFFTHALLAGLRGAADKDRDKRVTLAEAWRMAHAKTLAKTHAAASAQHPEMDIDLAGEGEIVLTELSRAKAVLVLGESIIGSVLVLEARTGRVLIEVDKLDAAPVSLAVPPGRLSVQLRQKGEQDSKGGEFSLEWGGEKNVALTDLTTQTRLASVSRGAGDIDLTPMHLSLGVGGFWSPHGAPGATAFLALEHRVFQSSFFIGASLAASYGRTENERFLINHASTFLSATATLEHYLGKARLFGGVDAGLGVIKQSGVRRDAERVTRVLGRSPTINDAALSPAINLRLGAQYPLLRGAHLLVLARGGAQSVPVADEGDSAHTLLPKLELLVGIAFEL